MYNFVHFQTAKIVHIHFNIYILENEIDLKDKRAQERRLKFADSPVIKKIEDFDFNLQKAITKKQINRLLEMDWIDRMYNLIFLGTPGLGKTHISISLGYRSAEMVLIYNEN